MKNYLAESMTSYMGKLDESISGWNEDEYTHFAFRCQDCFALIAGDNDEWICDEVGKPCSQVVECPEGLGILVDESLKEDYNPQLQSDVYNALADIMFKYHKKGIKVTPEQMQSAFEWFDVHFWADEDLDEACNSEPKEELKEDINTPFIKIYKEGPLAEEGWDYPVEELDYLLEEHPGESFVLQDDRLYEMTEE